MRRRSHLMRKGLRILGVWGRGLKRSLLLSLLLLLQGPLLFIG